MMKRILLAACPLALMLAVGTLARAAAPANIAGTWQLTHPNGPKGHPDVTMQLIIWQDGAKITGSMIGPRNGGDTLLAGTVDGNNVSWSLGNDAGAFTYHATVSGDAMQGTIQNNDGTPNPFTAKLVAAAATAPPAKVSGVWMITHPNGPKGHPDISWPIMFHQDGLKLSGNMMGPRSGQGSLEGEVIGGQIRFTRLARPGTEQAAAYFNATVSGNSMRGVMQAGGKPIPFSAQLIKTE